MVSNSQDTDKTERLRRWRLILGGGDADGICSADGEGGPHLGSGDMAMDQALAALYDDKQERRGGLGGSAPKVARWLGDIRQYFPSSVVRVMQQDALERLNLHQMLLEPEMLSAVEADVHLVANLMALNGVIPEKTKETARLVVRKVVDELMQKLQNPMQQAVMGSLNRSQRNNRPRHSEIDWHRTIRANLQHYQPEYSTIVPERLIGFGRKRSALKSIILCVDQSGSMAPSVVYASIFAAVLASIPAVRTQLVVFDTAVVDLTELLQDPVDVLFGTQLGGGTDINQALSYCQSHVRQPQETILVLISDLYEGGNNDAMIKRVASLVASGVQMITLLALSDEGAPCFDHRNAAKFARLGVPTFACTPDQFPDLMSAAISHSNISQWAAKEDIVTA
ncbi:VWA domain-containing protein [Leptolyngbyaceae cyanobacterium CCMR0082]|uniref:VWA domain-containing protein n=2 Tax=Adonisia turfae TaxID=2950184 RepID=A0A6M0SCA4_9CYAN|nr:VWA domain-containing protein [Adonisia turfae]NEZ60084.1 VWA domain-containing protein [Adonisia turfae CCMR0081]NEZ65713.1 VWA domain-containing protein [Adonisia turfae CCMR0082]